MNRSRSLLFFFLLSLLSLTIGAGTAEAAPGGVTTNLQLWLNSDTGPSSSVQNGIVSSWLDQSGLGRDVTALSGKEPLFKTGTSTSAINFHPTVYFTRSSNQYLETSVQGILPTDNAYTQFVVYQEAATTSSMNILGAAETAGTHAITITSASDRPNMFHNATQISGTSNVTGTSPGFVTARYAGGGGAGFFSTKGIYKSQASVASYVGGTTIDIGTYHKSTSSFDGSIAEVLIYDRALSTPEVTKVETTLALKYGIRSPQDYVSSAGTTVFASTTNSGYQEGIFGLARDVTAGLDQRVAKSMGTSTLMVLATTQDFTNPNSYSGRTSLTDGQYMIVGNNGGTTSFTNAYDGVANTRMNRVWKVQETGSVGSVYVAIPNTVTFPNGTPKVVISSDTSFNHLDTVVSMTNDGTYYWAQINPSSGQYISFASPDATVVDCSNYDNALNASCATTVYASQYDTDLATGNWLNPSNGAGTATYTATSAASLATYINALHAGDILELADGTWNTPIDLAFTATGTQSQPITIRAKHPGAVVFTNTTQLEFRGSWIRVEGFKFSGTYIHPDPANNIIALRMGRTGISCSHCLLSNMDFESFNASDPTNRAFPMSSNGQWNTVASSTFRGKTDSGVEIAMAINNLTNGETRDYFLVKGNYFADRVDSGLNGYEGLRMGDSGISFLDSRSYVIGNLFENYTGEAELISLKRNNITVRGNTFINSGHTPVSARESEYSTIEANIVDGMNISSNGGFRLNGAGHTVVHNILQNMDYGDGHIGSYSPFVVYKGQLTGAGVDYRPVTNMLYGFNTISNSRNAFYTSGTPSGLTTPVYPSGTYSYNILSGIAEAALSVDSSSTISFSSNIYNGSNLGTTGTGFDTVTNASIASQNGVYYSSSPSLDYTIKPYRVLYADMGFSTTTLFKLEYVNASPEQTIPLTKLTSSYVGAHYDTTTPVISSIVASSTVTNRADISWTTDEVSTSQVFYGLTTSYGSSSTLSTTTSTSHAVSLLGLSSATTYHYVVVSTDPLGNTATSSDQTFTTATPPDTTAPVLSSISSGTPGQTTVTITWTTDEASNSRIDYGLTTSYGTASTSASLSTSHSITLSGLVAGTTYHYRVQSTDASGNATTSSDQTFTTAAPDTTAPVISAISSGTPGQTSAIVSWTTDEGATSRVAYGLNTSYGSYTTFDPTLATSHSQPLSSLTAATTYHYVVVSTDASGNTATSSDQTFITAAVPDTTAPVISAISSGTPGQTSTTVTWTTDENATSRVTYGLTSSYGSYTTFDETTVTSHSQLVSGLTSATTYHYAVVSTDSSGNTATSSDATFTTAVVPDTTAPVISSISSGTPGQTTATITWTTDEASDSRVNYGTTTSYGTASTSAALGTSHSITLSGLTSATTYHYAVVSTDSSGNTATSSDATFTTAVIPDTTAPIISSISVATTTTSATITWTTDESADSRIDFGFFSAYGTESSSASLVTSHSITLSGLSSATTYHYRVQSTDAASNAATSSDATFTTATAPDITAPDISAISSGAPGQTSTTVTWTTDESATSQVAYGLTTSYDSYTTLDATLATSHSQLLSSLTAATTYHYAVVSTDASGNTATSSDQTFVTSSVPDTTAPVISAISSGTPGQTSATVSWTTDESATGRVAYGLTTSYDSYTTFDAALSTSHSQSLSSLSSGTSYHYAVVSTDASGNTATSSDQTFTTGTATVSSGGGGGGGGSSGGGGGGSTVTLPVSNTGTTFGTINTAATTIGAPLTPALKFSRPLNIGSRGMDVSFIQNKLAQDKTLYPEGKITGFYGALTAAAVLRFQTRYGILTALNAGIVDATTFTLISSTAILPAASVPVSSSVSVPGVNLTLGSKGNPVTSLQNLLIRAQKGPAAAALSIYGATGYFGAATRSALAEFQRAVGITPASGYFGPKTQAYLQTAGI